jgi:hypothetical protein
MTLSVEQMRKSIKDNQLDYVTIKSIENMDYDKISLIIEFSMHHQLVFLGCFLRIQE